MNIPLNLSLPSWVRKRDGRLVPFDADRVCRALFAATESCRKPDAFLARELADVAVHFLAEETEGTTPTTEQVHEIVVKVLRELKQYELALAFEDGANRKHSQPRPIEPATRPDIVVRFSQEETAEGIRAASLRSYSLQQVFTRDLVAAHQDGLITLGGLETPGELSSCVVGPMRRVEDLLPRLEESAQLAGQTLVLDGVDHVLARTLSGKRVSRSRLEESVRNFVENLARGLRLTDRQAVVNLNAAPPPWAEEVAGGPLFGVEETKTDQTRPSLMADLLAESLLECGDRIRVDWHLNEADVAPENAERLLPLARGILAGGSIVFVLDRARRPVTLAEGIDRARPAVLLHVALNLPRLAALLIEGTVDPLTRPKRLRDKLRSLVRLTLSAALQKREYLRRHINTRPGLASGFLLERACLMVTPLGLDEAVSFLNDKRLCAADESLSLGRVILERLRDVLHEEGRASALETCLDAVPGYEAAGPTCWDRTAAMKTQLRVLGELHTSAGGGTGVAFLPHEPPPTAEQILGWLRWAEGHTFISRLQLRRPRPPLKQMTFE